MTTVLIVGGLIAGIGTVLLVLAFRAFGGTKAGRPSPIALMAALVAFVFACCLALFLLAQH
ncbi:MAG: hypothetical protein ABI779_25365 [Acidobacteriota bacterium]